MASKPPMKARVVRQPPKAPRPTKRAPPAEISQEEAIQSSIRSALDAVSERLARIDRDTVRKRKGGGIAQKAAPTDETSDSSAQYAESEDGPHLKGAEADAPKDAIYDDRVVAFVDILGFKEIVLRSAADPDLVRRIHNALDLRRDNFAKLFAAEVGLDREPNSFDDLFHTFSDCIVISVRPTVEEVGLLVFMAFRICRQLLTNGFLSRGGVARGKLLHRVNGHSELPKDSDGLVAPVPMVFGPAFIEAYNFESAHADGPRVILQNAVWQLIDQHCEQQPHTKLAAFLRDHVRRAVDGPAYIDIFADFQSSGRFYNSRRDLDSEISVIHSHICGALDHAADKPHHFKKNAQLARQFNTAIRLSERHQHQIPASKLPSDG